MLASGNLGYAIATAGSRRAPDKVALTCPGRDDLTFGQLNAMVNRRAHSLARAGVTAGMRVGVLLHQAARVIDLYLALAKIGAIVVPSDPFWTDVTAAEMMDQDRCAAFIYDTPHEEKASRLRDMLPGGMLWIRLGDPAEECSSCDGPAACGVTELDPLTAAAPDGEPDPGAGPDDLLGIFRDRARPGRVLARTHASCLAAARAWQQLPPVPDAVFATGPDIGGAYFVAGVAPALHAGMRVVLENNFGLVRAPAVIAAHQVSHLCEPATFYSALLAARGPDAASLTSLRVLLCGERGEAVPPELAGAVARELPGAAICADFDRELAR